MTAVMRGVRIVEVAERTFVPAADPQTVANGYIQDCTTVVGVPFRLAATPVQFDGQPMAPRRAPEFNEHGEQQQLRSRRIAMSPAEVDQFLAEERTCRVPTSSPRRTTPDTAVVRAMRHDGRHARLRSTPRRWADEVPRIVDDKGIDRWVYRGKPVGVTGLDAVVSWPPMSTYPSALANNGQNYMRSVRRADC